MSLESPEADRMASRINRAVAQILDNEALTAELDDYAAKSLIDWGIACATTVVGITENMSDEAAEAATYPRLKAVRRMMREISKWAATLAEGEALAAQTHYPKIIEQATLVYGDSFRAPKVLTALPDPTLAENPQRLIQQLRLAIDPDQKTNTIS